jgi:flagella basal body P-ring formation protein FlgA
LPAPARALRIRLAPREDFIGTVRVELEFFAPEQPDAALARRAASVDLAVERTVWIASTALRRGAVLEPASVRAEVRDLRDVPQTALETLDAVWGQRVKIQVKEGTPLLASHFDSPDLVRRGDTVDVEAGRDGLEMRVTARALQPGKLGDLIRVENPSSHKSFAVRITGRGTAELARRDVGDAP